MRQPRLRAETDIRVAARRDPKLFGPTFAHVGCLANIAVIVRPPIQGNSAVHAFARECVANRPLGVREKAVTATGAFRTIVPSFERNTDHRPCHKCDESEPPGKERADNRKKRHRTERACKRPAATRANSPQAPHNLISVMVIRCGHVIASSDCGHLPSPRSCNMQSRNGAGRNRTVLALIGRPPAGPVKSPPVAAPKAAPGPFEHVPNVAPCQEDIASRRSIDCGATAHAHTSAAAVLEPSVATCPKCRY